MTYQSAKEALHVLLAVPFALTGGIFLLKLLGYNFSVAVWVGLWSTQTGAEVMKPLATPVLGGMISSLIHVLIVAPVIRSPSRRFWSSIHGPEATGTTSTPELAPPLRPGFLPARIALSTPALVRVVSCRLLIEQPRRIEIDKAGTNATRVVALNADLSDRRSRKLLKPLDREVRAGLHRPSLPCRSILVISHEIPKRHCCIEWSPNNSKRFSPGNRCATVQSRHSSRNVELNISRRM